VFKRPIDWPHRGTGGVNVDTCPHHGTINSFLEGTHALFTQVKKLVSWQQHDVMG
jgi:hypothetical protein